MSVRHPTYTQVPQDDACWVGLDYNEETNKIFDLTITFEPQSEKADEYLKIIGHFNQSKKAEDFFFICKNENIIFNKSQLAMVSPVFSTMIDNSTGKAELKFDDDEFESIKILKDMLEKKTIDVEKITSDLAFFADKYDIPCLLQLCFFNFCSLPITKENILDMFNIYDKSQHDKLFSKLKLL